MPTRIPINGKWVAPTTPQTTSEGGDVLTLPTTGDSNLDQILRQLADHAISTRKQAHKIATQHASAIVEIQQKSPQVIQAELSTKGSAPLNIQGLLGVPAALAKVPVNNTGGAANLQGNAFAGTDPGPTSNTVAKYKQFTDVDGTAYFIPLFQ